MPWCLIYKVPKHYRVLENVLFWANALFCHLRQSFRYVIFSPLGIFVTLHKLSFMIFHWQPNSAFKYLWVSPNFHGICVLDQRTEIILQLIPRSFLKFSKSFWKSSHHKLEAIVPFLTCIRLVTKLNLICSYVQKIWERKQNTPKCVFLYLTPILVVSRFPLFI